MSLSFCVLASGSKGNSLYVSTGDSAVLVDCGLSAKQTLLRLELRGLSPHKIKAILITHEHGDHLRGVRVLAKRLRIPALATERTWAAGRDTRGTRHQAIKAGEEFQVDGLSIHPFTISHDAADPVGMVISAGTSRLGLATDLGVVTKLVKARLAGCQGLILEHNHDLDMLARGPYPHWLKQRVRSRDGHLSNEQGAQLLAELHHQQLQQVLLAHLSETNNSPELARQAAARVLSELDSSAKLSVAQQSQPSEVFEI